MQQATATATTVELSGPQIVTTMAATHATLRATLTTASTVVLDCTQVTQADLSFVQLLLAAHRHCTGRGKGLTLSEPPGGSLKLALIRGGFLEAAANGTRADRAFWRQPEADA